LVSQLQEIILGSASQPVILLHLWVESSNVAITLFLTEKIIVLTKPGQKTILIPTKHLQI
jgi:hypothetical protein